MHSGKPSAYQCILVFVAQPEYEKSIHSWQTQRYEDTEHDFSDERDNEKKSDSMCNNIY